MGRSLRCVFTSRRWRSKEGKWTKSLRAGAPFDGKRRLDHALAVKAPGALRNPRHLLNPLLFRIHHQTPKPSIGPRVSSSAAASYTDQVPSFPTGSSTSELSSTCHKVRHLCRSGGNRA